MKTFLRKAIIAVAAMIASVNVMAQSFELKKEFAGESWRLGHISPWLTQDGNLRLLSIEANKGEEENENGDYVYKAILNKLSVLNSNLEVQKEFTSGPLFEQYVDVTVESVAKTLKVDSIVKSDYMDINDFYRYFRYDGYYGYEDAVNNVSEEILKPYLEEFFAKNYQHVTTYNGYKIYIDENHYYDYMYSNYVDWGKQYPKYGWIYNAYNDVQCVEFCYSPDELEEVNRYEDRIVSAYYNDDVYVLEMGHEAYSQAVISQTLFNNDEKYEFILPVMEPLEGMNYYSGKQTIYYEHEAIGYKIVSEDGTVLQEIIVNEARDSKINIEAFVLQFGDKKYFIIERYDGSDYSDTTYFYEINKNTNSIQKVREMPGSMRVAPTVANRNEEITISINDDNCNVARELIITGVNGKLIERRTIPAGENTFKVNAGMMRSGMYNFTLQKKGEVVDNSKVIIK